MTNVFHRFITSLSHTKKGRKPLMKEWNTSALCIHLLGELVSAQGGSGGQGLADTPVGCRWRISSVSQVIKCPSHPRRGAVQPRSLFQSPSVWRAGATIWSCVRSVRLVKKCVGKYTRNKKWMFETNSQHICNKENLAFGIKKKGYQRRNIEKIIVIGKILVSIILWSSIKVSSLTGRPMLKNKTHFQ